MPTEAKRETVAELREQIAGSRTLIVSEYRGLTVREIGEIRRSLRKQDVTYRVVKNRLMKIAAADSVRSALDELLVGPTAIAFGQDEGATAKAVMDTMRPYKQVRITGALLGDRAIDADGVVKLAALPSRDVLLVAARRCLRGAAGHDRRPVRRAAARHRRPRRGARRAARRAA